jgi:Amidohydrolase family
MATIILYNGPIYTLDPARPRVQALAIRDGRVLAAGTEGKVQAATGGRAEGINLHGRAVIPALTDAHVHLLWHGLARREIRLEGVDSLEIALKSLAAGAAALPEGAWLRGGGWDHTLWGGQWPTAAMLDELIPDRPAILVRKDGHSAWVNSRALEIAGIDNDTPDPPGGSIQREKKRATGILLETAVDLVRNHLPELTEDERLAALQDAAAEAHSYGMIGVQIPPGLPSEAARARPAPAALPGPPGAGWPGRCAAAGHPQRPGRPLAAGRRRQDVRRRLAGLRDRRDALALRGPPPPRQPDDQHRGAERRGAPRAWGRHLGDHPRDRRRRQPPRAGRDRAGARIENEE